MEETSEEQLEQRNSCMRLACILTIPTMVVSCIAFVIGAIAVSNSAPGYTFPYSFGGAMIAGTFTLISSCVHYQQYRKYKIYEDDITKKTVQIWHTQLCCLCPFVSISIILAFALSGVWAMVRATAEKEDFSGEDRQDSVTNYNYGVATFVLVLILAVLQGVLYSVCSKFKNTYYFNHYIQGNDEYFIPSTTRRRNMTTPTRETRTLTGINSTGLRVNYSNAPRLVPESPVTIHSIGTRRLNPRESTVSSSGRNNERNWPRDQFLRTSTYSIPIPELYNGFETTPSVPTSGQTISPSAPHIGASYSGNRAGAHSANLERLNMPSNRSPRNRSFLSSPPPRYDQIDELGFSGNQSENVESTESVCAGNQSGNDDLTDSIHTGNQSGNDVLTEGIHTGNQSGNDIIDEEGLPTYEEVIETGAFYTAYL